MSYFYVLPPIPEERKLFIESLLTANGGYTKDTLARLGVSWPPVKGWKEKLIKDGKLTK